MLYATKEIFIWLSVLAATPIAYYLYSRWEKTDHLSPGHFWSGILSTFLFSLSLVICAAAPQLAYLFCWVGIVAIGISLGYEHWYFNKYPVTLNKIERNPPYIPRNEFMRWMGDEPSSVYPKWLQPVSPARVQLAIVIFLVGFGFVRVMNSIAYGTEQVALERKKAREEVVQTKQEVKQEVKQQVNTAVAPVLQVSQQALNQLKTNVSTLQTIKANTAEEEKKSAPKPKKKVKSKVAAYMTKLPAPRTALDSLESRTIQPVATLTH